VLLSKSGEYALLALLHLAERSDTTPVRVKEIAAALGAPTNYLSKVLHQLSRAGVLHSVRGPHGGFSLAIPTDELSLAEALGPIEAERLGRRCLLGRPECRDDDPCAAHEQWRSLSDHIDRFLDETTLATLLASDAKARRSRSKPEPTRRSR
jgi:Rrf2 family iron-sulfur cluster assembly transcriptional regulator